MIALLIALLLQDDRVRDLVEKLSGDAIDVREEAAAALVELGPEAVPLLEKLGAAGDAERRGRIAAIVKEIGRDAVLRRRWRPAKRVDAAWKDLSLAEALRQLAAGCGEDFSGAETLAGKVTLDLGRASIWEALDALSRATPDFAWAVEGEGIAVRAAKQPPCPARVVDELRVWLDAVDYAQDVDFSGASRDWATAGLNVAWTKGLAPATVELRATEIYDKTGRNLLPPAMFRGSNPPRAPDEKTRQRREETRVGLNGGATIDRIRGYAVLGFPRAYEDARVPFGPGAAVKAGDAQVTVRGGTSTKGSCAFQVMITFPSSSAAARLPPSEVAMIDDLGAEHPATGRGQAMSSSGTSFSLHQNYEAALPADRRPASIRLRLLTDVFERRVDFDFENLPSP